MQSVLKKSSAQNSHRGNGSSRLSDKIEDGTIRSHSAQSPRLKPTEILSSRTRSASPQPPFSSPRYGNLRNFQVKKFHGYYYKIIDQLENISKTVDDMPEEPDSLVDLHRQRKRANEFAVRFSRNHLYQIKRQLGEIKRMLVVSDNLSKNESANLYKNILLAFQAGSQGLQNYINYMSIPQSAEVPEKIKELIVLLKELFLCCEHLSIPMERTDEFMRLCTDLLMAYDFKIEFEESKSPKKKLNRTAEAKETTESNKYSMYKAKLINSNWKKQTEALAKIKFGLPPYLNKKKAKRKDDKKAKMTCDIYTQKMHPKCGKYFGNKFVKFDPMKLGENEKNENPQEKKSFPRKRHGTPREVTSHDEDIETIVQSIMDDEDGVVKKTSSIKLSSSDESIHLEKSHLKDALTEAFQKLHTTEKQEVKESLKKILRSICHQKKQSQESLAPNVKIYHIKSKDLTEENDKEDEAIDDALCANDKGDFVQTFKEQKEKDLECSKERTLNLIFKPIATKKSDGKSVEKSAVPKGKIKLTIPEETVNNLTKYRKAFKTYCKSNIMYKKDAARKPWDLVATIADKLIDDVLANISYGLEDETVLEKLYYNELLTAV